MSWYTCIGRDEQQVPARRSQQRDMHRHDTPIIIDRYLVHRSIILVVHICIIVWYICTVFEGQGASDGAPAPATGHARVDIEIKTTAGRYS